jgi:hypothetical protein
MPRTIFQSLVALLGWAVFGLLWWLAFRGAGPSRAVLFGLLATIGVAVLLGAVAGAWVAWNVHVWRRHGPPPVRLPHRYDYSHDVAGRPVQADFASLKASRYVVIDLTDGPGGPVKVYSEGDEVVTAEEAASCRL